jgi:hypothetical protein
MSMSIDAAVPVTVTTIEGAVALGQRGRLLAHEAFAQMASASSVKIASSRRPGPTSSPSSVNDLAVLVNRPVQVHPASGDLEIGLVHEPAVSGDVPARPGGVDQLGGEPLYPPVDVT